MVNSITSMAVVAASALMMAACSSADDGDTPKTDHIEIVYTASETDKGVCRPEALVRVDKQGSGLYKIHGSNRFEDVRNSATTAIPLQFIFSGYNPDTGVAESRSTELINSDTPCEHLRIRTRVEYCLYDGDRRTEQACHVPVKVVAEGFAEIIVTEDYPG